MHHFSSRFSGFPQRALNFREIFVRLAILFFLSFGAVELAAQGVTINEFLAVNDGGLRDEDGDRSDWIEIRNGEAIAVDLAGWFLTDDAGDLQKWSLPELQLPPGGFAIVFASGKDRPSTAGSPHTSFKLSSGGEYLALVEPDGVSIAHEYAPEYPGQVADVSFGFSPDSTSGDAARFFVLPTPGTENDASSFEDFVADTRFTMDRGFYEAPFDLVISTDTVDATVRYTTDGSVPTETTGIVYAGPIRIDATTTLRAAAFRPGYVPTNVDTHTYLFPAQVLRQTGSSFPTLWGRAEADYEMDPDVVDDPAYRDTVETDIVRTIPTLSLVMDVADLFGPDGIYSNTDGRGQEWERPCSMELIYPDDWRGQTEEAHAQLDCGIRIFGFGSRPHFATLKHSLRLLFKSKYGPSKLRAELFKDFDVSEVDDIVLRGQLSRGWNDGSPGIQQTQYLRDSWARYTARDMGKLTTSSGHVHLYLNGLYWGLYNPVERPQAEFMVNHLGGEEEDYDALNARVGRIEVIDGSRESWDTAVARARSGPTTLADFEFLQEYLDLDDLADYVLINYYTGNRDWTGANGNNMRVAGAPGAAGGYRAFCWDMEYSVWGASDNVIEVNTQYDTPAMMHAFLRANPEYRLLFADRVYRHFFNGGALTAEATSRRWLERAGEIEGAIVGESARWGDRRRDEPYTRDVEWKREQNRLVNDYFPERTGILLEQLRTARLYPDLEPPTFNQRGGEVEPGFVVGLKAPVGTVLFTVDGTDPRLPGGAVSPTAIEFTTGEQTPLFPERTAVRTFVPQDESLGLDWTVVDFDDALWVEGETGVGFERSSGYESFIGADVGDRMFEVSGSVYARVPFILEDPAVDFLVLRMRYDDGFVVYLNGRRVAAVNEPPEPKWDSVASASHPDAQAVEFEDFDLSAQADLLRAGMNILAIHGLNRSAANGDFLMAPQLVAAQPPGPDDPRLITQTTQVKSRALENGEWSALADAVFVTPGLRITEVFYHPPTPTDGTAFQADDFEFVELTNVGGEPLELAGFQLAGGVRFSFEEGGVSALEPGGIVLVVKNLEAFSSAHDASRLAIAGEYDGNLSNRGETITLLGSFGERILDFQYADTWHPSTDGEGPSLMIVDAAGAPAEWGAAMAWVPSPVAGGTPGIHEDGSEPAGRQRIGNANEDNALNIADAIVLPRVLFDAIPPTLPCGNGTLGEPSNMTLLDSNTDGQVDVSDAVFLLDYLFRGGPPPGEGIECILLSSCSDACGSL